MSDERARRRRHLSDIADLAGIGCLVTAGWSWNQTLGVALLGGALLLVGWVISH